MPFDPEALPVPDLGLLCLNCGYPLAGLSAHRCPECGRAFTMEEHIPPGDFPALIFRGEEVTITSERAEMLRAARIPFIDSTSHAANLYGLSGPTQQHTRLSVPRDRYFETIDILRRAALGEPQADEAAPAGPDWSCAKCGEANPGTFDICWNCGRARGEE